MGEAEGESGEADASGAVRRASPQRGECAGRASHLEAVLVAAENARLAASVPRAPAAHDARLDEDARAAVGVGPFLAGDGGEGDGVLVVVRQVEVAREPALDATAGGGGGTAQLRA